MGRWNRKRASPCRFEIRIEELVVAVPVKTAPWPAGGTLTRTLLLLWAEAPVASSSGTSIAGIYK